MAKRQVNQRANVTQIKNAELWCEHKLMRYLNDLINMLPLHGDQLYLPLHGDQLYLPLHGDQLYLPLHGDQLYSRSNTDTQQYTESTSIGDIWQPVAAQKTPYTYMPRAHTPTPKTQKHPINIHIIITFMAQCYVPGMRNWSFVNTIFVCGHNMHFYHMILVVHLITLSVQLKLNLIKHKNIPSFATEQSRTLI